MSFLGSLFGQGPSTERVGMFTDEQQQALSQILSQALSGMQEGNNLDFGPIETQARRDFQGKTIPGIMERFAGLGANRASSGLASALGSAGSDLETNLASMRSRFGLQKQGYLQNLMGMGLRPQFDSIYRPQSSGLLGNFLTSTAGALPQLLQLLFKKS